MEKYNIIILIPARNEFRTLNKILRTLINKNFQIILIDDASSDETLKIKNKKNLTVIRNKKKFGYENSIIKGFKYIKKLKKFSHIVTFDADGEHKVSDLKKFNKFVNYDLVIGKRNKMNRFLEKIISYLFFRKYKLLDPLSGLKMYSIKSLYNLNFSKELFLVDLSAKIIINEKLNSINTKINTKKRKDEPRIGNSFYVNFKLIKILIFLIFS